MTETTTTNSHKLWGFLKDWNILIVIPLILMIYGFQVDRLARIEVSITEIYKDLEIEGRKNERQEDAILANKEALIGVEKHFDKIEIKLDKIDEKLSLMLRNNRQ